MFKTLLRCFGYLKPHWRLMVGTYLCMLGINLVNIVNPQFIRWIIDNGIQDKNFSILAWSSIGLLGLTFLRGIMTFFEGRWSEVASQNVAFDVRNAIQKKLTILSFSYHDKSQAGELLSRAIQDVDRIRFLTGRASIRIFESSLLIITTAAILVWMKPQLGLLAIASIPLLFYRALAFGSEFRPLSLNIQQQLAILTTRVEQNLRGARVVKTFAQENAEIAKFAKENEAWLKMSNRAARLQATFLPMLNLISNVSTIVIMWYGGTLVINQQLTLGELVAFTAYLGQLINPIRMLGNFIPAVAIAEASARRIFEILDSVPEVRESPNAITLSPLKGHVRFEHVSFSYGKQISVLKDIDFEAHPGQIIALLGMTGSGKSTVTNLIPRFYDPTVGKILVDDIDIRTVTLDSLRGQIGMVLQETTLFAATIRENILFGRPTASEEEMIAAAQAAQAHDFIAQLPKGYETHVGERGITLSGGQKQRVAIARALLTNPRILILDDATSSVDTETEQLIRVAMDELMKGRTTFIIAHRLSTLQRADLILVLEKGQIVAQGKHETLLQISKLYSDIYNYQLNPDLQSALHEEGNSFAPNDKEVFPVKEGKNDL